MPRKFRQIPKYGLHKATGQARVVLNGRTHYLGGYGTAESRRAYDQLITAWLSNEQALPSPEGGPADLTVNELVLSYLQFAQIYYVKNGCPTSEYRLLKLAFRWLIELHGFTVVDAFGPLALKAVRQTMIDGDLCRNVINQNVGRIKRLFRWGVENELVAPAVFQGLAAVRGLPKGRSKARESVPVKPVSIDRVEAIKPLVSAQVWVMIQLQLVTGMRPGETRLMRGRDLDMSNRLWEYRPAAHKTEHHDHVRVIPLGPRAQAILRAFLKADPDAYLFSPQDAEEQRHRERRRNRRSPMTPSQRKRKRKGRRFRAYYTKDSYTRVIRRACDLAFPPPEPLARREGESAAQWQDRLSDEQKKELKAWQKAHRWHPNQLRHSSGTKVRKELGLEAAQVWLGHSTADVTQIYAERNLDLARQIAAKMG